MKQALKKVISILTFVWAFLCTILIIIVFVKSQQFATELAELSFMKITPLYTGGELNYIVKNDSLEMTINKPVFEALIGESKEGFVQVTFSGIESLPQIIKQEIDYNNDAITDFKLKINTLENQTEFISLNPNVKSLIISSKVENNWLTRIKVKNENFK